MASGEDYQALTNGNTAYVADDETPVEKAGLEYIYITDNKLKYINNDYKKIDAKMYDYKCDVKLTVGNSSFKGHKKVLADASDYFAAMFSHDMKEKDETTIDLKEISPDGFGAMLDYFYHGHVTVEGKIVPNILEAGRFFHVEWILDICCDYMIRHLSLSDYPLTMQLADKYSLGDLRWEIFKYFGHNLPTLIEQETFLRDCSVELLLQFLMECLYVEVSEFFLLQVRYKCTIQVHNILISIGIGTFWGHFSAIWICLYLDSQVFRFQIAKAKKINAKWKRTLAQTGYQFPLCSLLFVFQFSLEPVKKLSH